MGRILVFSIVVIALITVLALPVFGQYGSSSSYNLQWKVIESGGNEGDDVTSTSYRLSSSIGQSTPVSDGPISSTNFDLYPGHRKIDLDMRYPFSWFTFGVEYASDTTFLLTWAGIDTTIEDGWGWGIWNYDVQYAIGAGAWTPWLDATADTFATFGPLLPEDVMPGEMYHFRIRARDLARNVAPWEDQDSVLVNYVVEFAVWTAPGLPTDASNNIVLSYVNDIGDTIEINIWEGHSAQVWCVPGMQAEVSRLSSDSDEEQRWMVNSIDDTIWTIDGTETSYDIRYWHQLHPIIHLDGPDASHTVATISHEQFGPGHLETDLYGIWQEWTDYGSLLEFADTTTGSPTLRAILSDSTRFHDIDAFFTDTIHYMAAGNIVVVQTSFGGDSVRTDGTWQPSPYYTDWFDMSSHEIAVKETVWISGCEIWVFDYWEDDPTAPRIRSVTITGDTVYTAVFHHEFRFDLANPSGYGVPVPGIGSYWHNEGDTIEGSITPLVVGGNVLTGYNGTGSALDGGGNEFWFELYDCSSIEWEWAPLSEMCTLWVFSPYGHPHPDGMWLVPCGSEITCSIEDSAYADGEWKYLTGWHGDGLIVPALGDSNIVSFRILATGWLVWEWGEDLMPLVISSVPSYHGFPEPDTGMHWLSYGSDVDACVTNPDDEWWCTGFDAWGSVASASADSVNFVLDSPTFIDWQWEFDPAELCTLWVFSHYGDPVPSVGMHIYPAGHVVTVYVPTPSGVHDCSGWTGTGSVPISGVDNHVSFTISAFSTLTWQWGGVEVPFVVQNPGDHDSPVPMAGIHYYAPGTEIDAWVTSPDVMWFCVGYNGFGDLPVFGYEDSVHFTINTPTGIIWLWDNDVVWLDVVAPAYSDADPPVGRTYHPRGRDISASVIDTVYEATDHRQVCTGWLGDGVVVPATGDTFDVDFTMTDNGSIDWTYIDQFELTLAHSGLPGGVDPDTLGFEGWYTDVDTAVLVTDSVVWDGVTPYVFKEWDDGDDGATIGNTLSNRTWVLMDDAYSLTAIFEPGILVDIIKSPEHDIPGWIVVDGDTFFTGHYHSMWAVGSHHIIEVSMVDSTDTIRYTFDAWRDALLEGASRDVAPISDTVFYADYFRDYHYIVKKSPEADTIGRLFVDAMVLTGTESVRKDVWWREGTSHMVGVTDRDSSETEKFIFQYWDDGIDSVFRGIGPVLHHDSISAIYNTKYLCTVEKDPPEPYGSIYIDGVRFDGVGVQDFWAEEGEIINIGVSKIDTITGSLYRFIDWEDGPTDTLRPTPAITCPDTFIANYDSICIMIRVEIGQHSVFPTDTVFWNIRDSLIMPYTETMGAEDSIKLYNFSNVAIDFGLMIGEIYDTSAGYIPDTFWIPGASSDENKFVLRARFNDFAAPPTTWWMTRDFIVETVYWAKNEGGSVPAIFGVGGENIAPYDESDNTEKLWLQFKTPRDSNLANHTRAITLILMYKVHLE